ncbi:MAG: DUF262 domain-containing protein [Planctomycetota bacterium]|jgi:hypothetical protein|nr:DUF262 domain-containing protein [Planctomycetota bacterium]
MKESTPDMMEELAADGSASGVEEDAYVPYPFDAEKISISNKKISLSNVIRRLERGLIHAVDLQRRENLWDVGRKSRLIESLMLRIPLPLFYAAEDKDDKLYIVDGLQRLSAIKGYVSGKTYKLESLEFLKELEGKAFDEIAERMQIRINETELDFAVIGPDSPPEVQRNIFKRLNTGGLPLTEQEIRHALYFGPASELLQRLVETEEFQVAVDSRVDDSRMAAQELVLRFLSFSIMGVGEYAKDEEMDSFLSDTMQIANELMKADSGGGNSGQLRGRKVSNKDMREIEDKFLAAMRRARALFDNCAFRITTPRRFSTRKSPRTPINKSLFEAWSVLLSNISEREFDALWRRREFLYQKIDAEFDDPQSRLRNFISKDSAKVAGVKGRHKIIREITDDVIKGPEQ